MKKLTVFIIPFIALLFSITVFFLLSGRYTSMDEIPLEDTLRSEYVYPSNSPITAEGKININTAPANTLILLSGIGDVLAQRIIDYREENGPFLQAEDLLNVKGIGKVTLSKIIDYIVVA